MQVLRSWRLEFWIFWWDYDSIILSLFFWYQMFTEIYCKVFRLSMSKNLHKQKHHLGFLLTPPWVAQRAFMICRFCCADCVRICICTWCEKNSHLLLVSTRHFKDLRERNVEVQVLVLGFAWGHWKPFLATSSWDCKGVQGRFLRSIHPSFWLTFWKLGWMTSKQM